LKDLEEKGHLRFLFITGVSKFSKVSIFSDLNNLTDITIDPLCSDLVGITQQELLDNFEERIQHSAKAINMSEAELLKIFSERATSAISGLQQVRLLF